MSKITGNEKSIYTLVTEGDKKLNIPYYQRPYSWEQNQLEDFWTSITDSAKSNKDLFFGSVITCSNEDDKDGTIDIVDGQQRIITFTLLFLALYSKYPVIENNFTRVFISNFFKRGGTADFRLFTLESDKEDFEGIKKLSIEDILREDTKINNNFLYAYRFFAQQLSVENFDEKVIDKLVYFITNKIQIIHVNAPSEEVAIETFQTINSMGMSLDEENIAKSILLIDAKEDLRSEWEDIFRTDNFKNVDFFSNYLMIEYSNDKRLDGGDYKKSKALKYFYDDLKVNPSKEEKIKEIIKYARVYMEILAEAESVNKSKDYFFCAKTFKKLGTFAFLPVLMQAVYTKQDVKKVADNLENIIMSYVFKGKYFNGFNKMLPDLLKDSFFNKSVFFTEEDIRYNVVDKKASNKKAGAILYLLEIKNFYSPNYAINTVSFNGDLSLEHIYPQKAKKYTEQLQNPDLIYSIGNMMILSPSWNSKNSNKPFIEKLELYKEDSIDRLKSSKYVLKQTEWLDNQIEENAEYILGLIKDTWINKA